jgi:prepilin-type N-terminal cleavage/methylation domain-containing protein
VSAPGRRLRRGFSVIEVTISVAVLGGLLIAAGFVLRTSGDLAQSAADEGAAADRVQQSLLPVANQLRRASFATLQSLDSTPFSDGENDVGVRFRKVSGFNGSPVLTSPSVVRWTRPVGSPEGEVTLEQDGVTVVLARHVTDFDVSRTGETLTIRATARSGPNDARGRTQTGRIVVRARNP